MKTQVAHHCQVSGYKKSVLPEFSQNMSQQIKGTLDYLGVNMYTSNMVKAKNRTNSDTIFWQDCVEAEVYQLSSWKTAASKWLKVSRLLYWSSLYKTLVKDIYQLK